MLKTNLTCASRQMIQIAETIKTSRSRTLLLTGETGVGKDVLARWAHSISPFARGPFVDINCAAIQETLWESEIFGHTKGAFTGALEDKTGQVELAEGGTLFLNEIGEMPSPTQAKLLTFLDTHEFQRVGSTDKRFVKTRVIAATNRDLEKAADAGMFRRDLFFRLAEVHIRVPPLRERPADILALTTDQLQVISYERGVPLIGLTDEAREMLLNGPWKGNVRQLQAVLLTAVERCIKGEEQSLRPEHLAPEMTPGHGEKENGEKEQPPSHNNGGSSGQAVRNSANPPSGSDRNSSELPGYSLPQSTLFEDATEFKVYLDQFLNDSGNWNISAAYRRLTQEGAIKLGRHAFARRVKKMFPDS